MSFARYKVIISYDGTLFDGFQRLLKPKRTVQGEFEAALKSLGWKGSTLWAAGRTDSGVHASGQVVAFDLDWRQSTQKLVNALNARLPQDIACQSAEEVSPHFHPRYHARWRKYQYRMFYNRQPQPLKERYAWRIEKEFDVNLMERAARDFVGAYDFAAFGSPYKTGGTTVREVYESNWQQENDGVVWTVAANSFLLHMVRRMMGLLAAIGIGKISPYAVKDYLGKGFQREYCRSHPLWQMGIVRSLVMPRVQWLAPACGLELVEVGYQPYR